MNILHIERSKLIREMIHDVVEKLGHDYYCSNSYKDAFHILDNVDVDLLSRDSNWQIQQGTL